jgi:hypothetical protein
MSLGAGAPRSGDATRANAAGRRQWSRPNHENRTEAARYG